MQPSPSAPGHLPGEVVSIQYLRGFAAMMVAAHHAMDQFAQTRSLLREDLGATGVDIFFVISGFVMTYTTGIKPIGRRQFLLRRFARIAPLYWILSVLTAALLIFAPQLVRSSVFEPLSLLLSLAFVPHWNPADPKSFSPMLKLGWTLNYEMIFYLVFALFLLARRRVLLTAVTLVFVGFVALRQVLGNEWAIVAAYGSPIVFEFVLGCLLGALDLRGFTAKLARGPAMAVIAAGACGLYVGAPLAGSEWRFLACGLPAAVIVGGFLALERNGTRFSKDGLLGRLGDASYSIYLAHLYAVIAFRVMWERLHLPLDSMPAVLAFIIPCALTGIAAGVAVYYLIERPANRLVAPLVRGSAQSRVVTQ